MSAVPKLRFPEFDGEWLETNIGSCGNFYYGKSAPKWSVSEDAPTPCIRYGELYTKFGATVDKIYSRTNIAPAKLRFSKGGEVLVPRVGEDPRDFAKCTMLPFSGVAIGEMISVFETDQNSLFFTYYFNTMKNQFAKMVAGGNPSNLYYENLKPLPIWRPSLPEQQKIASFLSSVDKKIDLLRQKKDALELYKKGLMQKIFSQEIRFKRDNGSDFPDWEDVPFNRLAERKSDRHKSGKVNVLKIIELENIQSSQGSLTGDIQEKIPSLNNHIFQANDVLFGKLRPYLQKWFYAKFSGACSSEIWVLRARQGVDSEFLYYLVQSEQFLTLTQMSSGSKMPRADWKVIAASEFQLPSLAEQVKISRLLAGIDQKISKLAAFSEQMETFKKGLLQQMFV
jgi:type I restriction enzyme S subunit